MTPAETRTLAVIQAELARLARYDDESVVHPAWIRQRYDRGAAASYAPARTMAVRTAWHEAGHAVAALAVGARFSSASIRHGSGTQGPGLRGRHRGDRTQNSLPSGSASTVHGTSLWPMSSRTAPAFVSARIAAA